MPRWRWTVALLPALAGAAAARLLRLESVPDPLLELQTAFHLGSLLLTIGVVVSLAWLEGLVIWHIAQDRLDRAVSARQRMASEARQRFIRRFDHELKNPLTAAYAALDNLGAAADAQVRAQAVRDVADQLKRAEALVRAVRKLADLESRPIERFPVDVMALLEEVREACEAGREVHAATELSAVGTGPWLVEGDRDLLWMLFYNLLENALKFGGDSAVSAEVARAEGSLRVTVTDRGPGIAADDVGHVFEELYRGENATGVLGSGIGLALVRTVAERHGGAVAVASLPGRGASFTVTLPLLASHESR